jgi:hypothetical protein
VADLAGEEVTVRVGPVVLPPLRGWSSFGFLPGA